MERQKEITNILDLKLIDNTYMFKSRHFIKYLINNKIENILFNSYIEEKNSIYHLYTYEFINNEKSIINPFKKFKNFELLNNELNELYKKYYKTHIFIDTTYLTPQILSTKTILQPILTKYFNEVYNIEYNSNFNIVLIRPIDELNYLVDKYHNTNN